MHKIFNSLQSRHWEDVYQHLNMRFDQLNENSTTENFPGFCFSKLKQLLKELNYIFMHVDSCSVLQNFQHFTKITKQIWHVEIILLSYTPLSIKTLDNYSEVNDNEFADAYPKPRGYFALVALTNPHPFAAQLIAGKPDQSSLAFMLNYKFV